MEYGLIPKLDQYVLNSGVLAQQVQPSNSISKLKSGLEASEIERRESFKETKEISEVKKNEQVNATSSEAVSNYHEVVLTNLNFGFNNSSRDFFVKAVRGEVENQYPTDDMMRLKAFLIQQQAEQQNSHME